MPNVLLLNPPHPAGRGFTREGRCTQVSGVWGTQWPPVTLATAAAWLLEDGHRVLVRDCPAAMIGCDRLDTIVREFRPDFVFWSTGTPTLSFDLSIAKIIKDAAPHAMTGVLGTHVTALPEEALSNPGVDLVIRREPEATIRELCSVPQNLEAVQGISYLNGDRVIHTPDRPFIDPEYIPAPAWELLNTGHYRLPLSGKPFLITAPIRGCPFRCTFCTAPIYYGKRLRKRPVELVLDEIVRGKKRFGIKNFFIWADTFTADKNYVHDFCSKIVDRGIDISWTCNSRVDTVDTEMLSLMKRAGLWMISFGIESGDEHVLKGCDKGITAEQSRLAVHAAEALKIRTAGHFIFGLPGETRRSMKKTLEMALSLPLDIAQFYAAAPFPGTRLAEEGLRRGWLKSREDFSQSGAAMELEGLSATEVDGFRSRAYRKFYTRPSTMMKIFTMTRPGAVRSFARALKAFLRWT